MRATPSRRQRKDSVLRMAMDGIRNAGVGVSNEIFTKCSLTEWLGNLPHCAKSLTESNTWDGLVNYFKNIVHSVIITQRQGKG